MKDLTWEKTNIVYQEKSGDETKYYFKFTRLNEQFKSQKSNHKNILIKFKNFIIF